MPIWPGGVAELCGFLMMWVGVGWGDFRVGNTRTRTGDGGKEESVQNDDTGAGKRANQFQNLAPKLSLGQDNDCPRCIEEIVKELSQFVICYLSFIEHISNCLINIISWSPQHPRTQE